MGSSRSAWFFTTLKEIHAQHTFTGLYSLYSLGAFDAICLVYCSTSTPPSHKKNLAVVMVPDILHPSRDVLHNYQSCLSLKSQELTALFLGVRLYCSFVMEYDIHTILDSATLITTLWVIYMIRFKLWSSYMEDKDNFAIYFVVIPCAILAFIVHPSTSHNLFNRISWAFCVFLEAVSVLPQLRVMQNTKIVESFTAHYVFALGVARFLSCAHWVLQVLDSRGYLLTALGHGLWPSMVLLSEIVQTFILADFCYYYVKSVVGGHLVLRLPSGVV